MEGFMKGVSVVRSYLPWFGGGKIVLLPLVFCGVYAVGFGLFYFVVLIPAIMH
jgi:hypothetical protein